MALMLCLITGISYSLPCWLVSFVHTDTQLVVTSDDPLHKSVIVGVVCLRGCLDVVNLAS